MAASGSPPGELIFTVMGASGLFAALLATSEARAALISS